MAEWTNVAEQTVNPGESIIFADPSEGCALGLIRHRSASGDFSLSGKALRRRACNCCCKRNLTTKYLAVFSADIAVATGGTAEAITVAMAINGSTLPASTMTSTPAAAEEFNNVSKTISVPIWSNCCQSLSLRNTSDQPIFVRNAVINIVPMDALMNY